MNRRDKMLGMDRDITRRDFLNGASIAISGSFISSPLAAALADGDNASAQIFNGFLYTLEVLFGRLGSLVVICCF